MSSDFDKAERLGQRRIHMLPVMAILLLTQQTLFIDWDGRAVSAVQMGGWTILALVMLAYLLTGGHWLAGKRVRELMNDEVTRANRAQALAAGFAGSIITAMLVFLVSPFEPIEAQRAAHMIVSIGLACALIRFALLERKALG